MNTLIRLEAHMTENDKKQYPHQTRIKVLAPPPHAERTIYKFAEWAKIRYPEKQIWCSGRGCSSTEGSSVSFMVSNQHRKRFVKDFKDFIYALGSSALSKNSDKNDEKYRIRSIKIESI